VELHEFYVAPFYALAGSRSQSIQGSRVYQSGRGSGLVRNRLRGGLALGLKAARRMRCVCLRSVSRRRCLEVG
jgi:hypothetical protein